MGRRSDNDHKARSRPMPLRVASTDGLGVSGDVDALWVGQRDVSIPTTHSDERQGNTDSQLAPG